MLTIFTPTYNRAYIIDKLYLSLCNQTCSDFEWLIVDDGSTDNTEDLISKYIAENKIKIRYRKQANGGKHRAINYGLNLAKGELFFIVDSDDHLSEDAVEWITKTAEPIRDDENFAGLSGIRVTPSGEKIGGGLDFGIIDSDAINIRLKHHISGDLAEVYKTKILRQYPFPTFDKEKFCPEALVWNRIAQKYSLRYCHKGIYICEYLPDGLTAKITNLRRKSPKASMTYYSEFAHTDIPFAQKVKANINFWRFKLSEYQPHYRMISLLGILTYIPGTIYKYLDSKKL